MRETKFKIAGDRMRAIKRRMKEVRVTLTFF